ncbi:putative membrane protein, partial [Plasmodium reichenowi]
MMDVYKEENSDLLNHQEEEISRNSNINDEFSETQLRDNVYEEREDEYINKHNMMDDIQIMVDEQDNNNNYDNNNYYDDNINNYDNNNYYDDNINNYDNNNYDDNTNNNSYYEYNQNAYDDNEPYNDNNNNNIINGSEYINEIQHNDEELY